MSCLSCKLILQVAETCQLAIERIQWLQNKENQTESLSSNPYMSVDPAPPCGENDLAVLKGRLLDETLPLFDRYRAMFSLRNAGTTDAVLALAEGKLIDFFLPFATQS